MAKFKTIKVSESLYDDLCKLLKSIRLYGWNHLGINRTDSPTLSSVLSEGVKKLENS
jgi:hypothetical protein